MPWKPPVYGRPRHRTERVAYQRMYDSQRVSPSKRGYGRRWQRLRKMVLARDCGICRRCGEPAGESAHVDHIVPRSQGGQDTMENLETLCHPCHSRKTATQTAGSAIKWCARPPRGRDFL